MYIRWNQNQLETKMSWESEYKKNWRNNIYDLALTKFLKNLKLDSKK